MRKFIRTKDGIYELKENMTINIGIYGLFHESYNTIEKHLFRNGEDLGELASQANAIDALCDLFYLDRGGDIDMNEFYDKYNFDVAKENYLEEVKHSNPVELKAYINTDKGLICVSKADNKGDLKLID